MALQVERLAGYSLTSETVEVWCPSVRTLSGKPFSTGWNLNAIVHWPAPELSQRAIIRPVQDASRLLVTIKRLVHLVTAIGSPM